MNFGLCGASGTGKTTLAKLLCKYAKVDFIPSPGREAFDALFLNPQVDYPFETRMEIQWKILELAEVSYKSRPNGFVADRTPMDFLAYMMADIARETLTEEQRQEFRRYFDACYELSNKYFTVITIIPPALKMQNDGIRPSCWAYAEHINYILMGLTADSDNVDFYPYFLSRKITDLKERLKVCLDIYGEIVKSEYTRKAKSTLH